MKHVLVCIALWFIPCVAWADLPQRIDGRYVSVTLCSVSEIGESELTSDFEGMECGISFIFLIAKTDGEEGRFALKELKDFRIGESYFGELSSDDIVYRTVINDFDDLAETFAGLNIEKPSGRSLAMTTKIVGSRVERSADLEVSPTFAWGGPPRVFTFSVRWSEIEER